MSLSDYQLVQVLRKTLKDLKNVDPDWEAPQIFVSGEFDSNQTDFERQCNQLEIGVLSGSEIVGKACLPILRAIIDDNLDGLLDRMGDPERMDDQEITADTTFEEVAKILGTFEWQYGSQHKIIDDVQVTLMNAEVGDYSVKKRVDKIDVYTLPRIIKCFEELVADVEFERKDKDV
jgi:hypothetical protein